jgi:hypothetical protein
MSIGFDARRNAPLTGCHATKQAFFVRSSCIRVFVAKKCCWLPECR